MKPSFTQGLGEDKRELKEEEIASGLAGFNERMSRVKEERKDKILEAMQKLGEITNDGVEELLEVVGGDGFSLP